MSSDVPPRVSNAVALIAHPDSVFAARVQANLADLQFRVERCAPSDRSTAEPSAAVVVVERSADIEWLRTRLDQSVTPTLVLTTTRELAADVLPLLDAWHDLAPAAESPGTIAWRLQRLIDLSRRAAVGLAALDPLTGLLNRSTLERQLRRVIEAQAPGEATGLLIRSTTASDTWSVTACSGRSGRCSRDARCPAISSPGWAETSSPVC